MIFKFFTLTTQRGDKSDYTRLVISPYRYKVISYCLAQDLPIVFFEEMSKVSFDKITKEVPQAVILTLK